MIDSSDIGGGIACAGLFIACGITLGGLFSNHRPIGVDGHDLTMAYQECVGADREFENRLSCTRAIYGTDDPLEESDG